MAEGAGISIVIPAYNEAPCLGKLHEELAVVCDSLPHHFEFLFVDDGSTDGTEEVLAELRRRDDRVRYLVMSRNFGHQGALSAGLTFAAGDAVIMMDADLQHPPTLIPRLLECWEAGYEVVNTVRLDTEDSSLRKRFFSRAFYLVFKTLTGLSIEPGSADFRLMAREPVDALNGLPETPIASSEGSSPGWVSARPKSRSARRRGGRAIPSTRSAAVCGWPSRA